MLARANVSATPLAAWSQALAELGTATVAGTLVHRGVRSTFIEGPVAWTRGRAIVGPALTLQFVPEREDLYRASEDTDPERQLHRYALYHTEPGDIVVADDDGAVVVPVALAEEVIAKASEHQEWEEVSRNGWSPVATCAATIRSATRPARSTRRGWGRGAPEA